MTHVWWPSAAKEHGVLDNIRTVCRDLFRADRLLFFTSLARIPAAIGVAFVGIYVPKRIIELIAAEASTTALVTVIAGLTSLVMALAALDRFAESLAGGQNRIR